MSTCTDNKIDNGTHIIVHMTLYACIMYRVSAHFVYFYKFVFFDMYT